MTNIQKLSAMLVIVLIGLLCSATTSVADVLEDALIAAWLFDENGGDTAEDASGNGYDGDIMGAKRVPGKTGRALGFDGNSNIVEIQHDEVFDLTAYTISAWIKTNPNGKWHHVAATYDGKRLRAYMDGEMEGETATDIPPDHNTEPIRIGRWGAVRGDFMAGIIDDVAIFSQALTTDEIRDITMKLRDALMVEASGKLAVTWGALKRSINERN